MALLHPTVVGLTKAGIPGNRRFYLIDQDGELFSCFDHGPLVSIVPTYDPEQERLELRFPDGASIEGVVGADGGPPVSTNFHGRRVEGRVIPGPISDAVSAFVGRPVRLVRTELDGAGSDVEHLTLLSTASVADLAARGRHEGPLDPRRFRLDLELDDTEPYEEDAWEGSSIRVGEATIQVLGQIPRCRVTTHDPRTGVRDWNTLTQIAKYRDRIPNDGGIPFGVYARVERPGTIRVGDPIDVLSESGGSGLLPLTPR